MDAVLNLGKENRCENLLLYHIEIVSVVSLVNDVLLRFDQDLKHGVQDLRELLLRKAMSGMIRQPRRTLDSTFFSYLVQSFEDQDVFAGVLKSAALLVRFGVHHPRLSVVVLVLVGVVRLCTHCGGTRDVLRRPTVDSMRYQCSSLPT